MNGDVKGAWEAFLTKRSWRELGALHGGERGKVGGDAIAGSGCLDGRDQYEGGTSRRIAKFANPASHRRLYRAVHCS